jgi:hypothetical protein
MKKSPAQPLNGYRLRILISLACLVFALPISLEAQANVPAPLPPAAQEALKKGIMAAKQQEWEIAIRSFQEARKTAPDAPEVFYDLGLAESKIPGRELRAIAWFGAYLSATTNASNASAVKDKIAELQIKNEGNNSRLIKKLQDAVGQKSGDNSLDLRDVAILWARVGDTAAALKVADLIALESIGLSEITRCDISSSLAEVGDVSGAKKSANLIQAEDNKSRAAEKIVLAQLKAGDIAAAQKGADLIQEGDSKTRARSAIAEAQSASRQSVPNSKPVVKVADWLTSLDDSDMNHWSVFSSALNTDPFLDLAGYLKSLPAPSDLRRDNYGRTIAFNPLRETISRLVSARLFIDEKLKQQGKR